MALRLPMPLFLPCHRSWAFQRLGTVKKKRANKQEVRWYYWLCWKDFALLCTCQNISCDITLLDSCEDCHLAEHWAGQRWELTIAKPKPFILHIVPSRSASISMRTGTLTPSSFCPHFLLHLPSLPLFTFLRPPPSRWNENPFLSLCLEN